MSTKKNKAPAIVLGPDEETIYILADREVTDAHHMLNALIDDALCIQNWEETIQELKDAVSSKIIDSNALDGRTIFEVRIRPVERAKLTKIDWEKV